MNYAPDDVHRSLRRFVAQILAPPWKVRTEKQPIGEEERQVCVVEPSSALTTGPRYRVSIPQGNVPKIQAFSAMAYPAMFATAAESRREAQRIAELLDGAFTLGLVDGPLEDQRNIGGPFRLPVYDFAGVPVKGERRGGPSDPYGFAWVDDLAVRPLQDPIDYLRFTVTCDVRLSWEQGGRIAPVAPTVEEMGGTFVAP